MTQETGKRPNGAAAAILAVRPARNPQHDYYDVSLLHGAAAVDTSYAIVRASFSPNHHSVFSESGWRRARGVTVIFFFSY
jgi:hypothetical protein